MRGTLPMPPEPRSDAVLRLSAETWHGRHFRATLTAKPSPQPAVAGRRYAPAAPAVFFSIAFGYAIVSLAVALGWFVLDVAPSATNRQPSSLARAKRSQARRTRQPLPSS